MQLPIQLSQFNETDNLKHVILGRWQGYAEEKEYIETVNEAQKASLPSINQLEKEFYAFQTVLEKNNINVHIPERVGKFVYDQLTPRDIGVTIGHRFVLCNMAKASRRYESAGIFSILKTIQGKEPNIIVPPEHNILIEGGDIIVDKCHIFVGISERTNHNGFRFLQATFGNEFKIVPVQCRKKKNLSEVLHLDCTFNSIGKSHALIYKEGITDIPSEISKNYKWIEINAAEQKLLATNVLSINKDTVISRKHPGCARVNNAIRSIGIKVEEIQFDSAPATGGSFRCCTLPLARN